MASTTTRPQPTNKDDDPWADLAAAARQLAQRTSPASATNPPNDTTQIPTPPSANTLLFTTINTLHPFSTATTILDTGCGSGAIMTALIAQHGPYIPKHAALVAGDSSPAMLANLRQSRDEKLQTQLARDDEARTLWERLRIVEMDAQTLEGVDDGTVSHVLGGHVYFLLEDYDGALRETMRVLGPGGVAGMTTGKWSEHLEAVEAAVERVRPGTGLRCIREEWRSKDGVERVMERAGFVDVDVREVESEVRFGAGEARGLAGILVVMPVVKEVIGEWAKEDREKLVEVLVGELERRGGEERVLRGSNFVTVGRKGL